MRGLKDILQLRLEAERQTAALPALMLEAQRIAASLTHGEHARRKAGTGQKFWQYRDYIPGDRPQDIDWRRSARSDDVLIRQKELETTQKTFFWSAGYEGMNFASVPNLRTKHECSLIISLALALLLMQAEEQIGVFGDTKTGRSENRLERITQRLSDTARGETLPQADHFSLPRHSILIQCGDYLSPLAEIESCFSKIAATVERSLVIQILDPAEIDLTYKGRVRFEGLTPDEKETINHVPSIREEYKSRMDAHIDGLRNICKRHHWLYILHRTDDDLATTLATIWQLANTGREVHR